MQANRTAYRYDTVNRRNRTATHQPPARDNSVNRESKFLKKVLWQGGISLVLCGALFGMQYLPFEPFSGIINDTKYMLQKNTDFAAMYQYATDFAQTNFTKEKMDGYLANMTAFFTGQQVPVVSQPLELDLILKSPVTGSVQEPYQAETGRLGFQTAKSEGVIAALGGTVKETGYNDIDGNYVILTHENGMETVYYQLSEVLVHTGDSVSQGMIVGNSGGTEDDVLYFGLKKDGAPIDPTPYFEENRVQHSEGLPEGSTQEQGNDAQK